MNFRNRAYYLIVVATLLLYVSLSSCRREVQQPEPADFAESKDQMVEVNKILVRKDQARIQGYVERQGWKMKETQTGLWYSIEEEGKGPLVETGQTVSLRYSVTLLDGTPLYNSEEEGIKTFEVGHGGVESGLEEGVLLLKEGSKGRFIMPPHLAHGLTGDGERIPARAIIIYELELINVSKP